VRRRLAECGNLGQIAQVSADDSGRVLVVDDDALIRATLATALADEGYSVRVAADGRAALDTLDEWLPDLIVLDLMMPVMDGHAFRAAQRDLHGAAHIPIIVLSAAHNVHARASNLGAAAVFPKPFDLGTLLDAVERTVRQPPTRYAC
jgi:two-component system, OmpR family, response regulator VicR